MATATLNIRMDTKTKDDFTTFCDDIGISASSLMNMFAKTVVKNQAVPFPITTRPIPCVPDGYQRLFPRNEEELEQHLERSAATPLDQCSSMEEGARHVRERLGW